MIDFPRVWQVARLSNESDHDPKCSYRVTHGGVLCDCHVVYKHPDFLSCLFIGKDGEIIEGWARRELRHQWE